MDIFEMRTMDEVSRVDEKILEIQKHITVQ